jgi:phosphoserine phosphatase
MRVFDVCGTLYNSNTTFDFILEYHKSRKKKFKYYISKALLSLPCKVLNKFKIISIRDSMILTLKGESKDDLSIFSKIFVETFLATKQKAACMDLLLAEPQNALLISASLDPVINAIANKLNVAGYSSILEYNKENLCTGKLLVDLKGIKSKKVGPTELELVVTDNMSDIDLIKNSKISYLVIHIELEKVNFL